MKEDVNHQFCDLWRTMKEPNWNIQVFMETVTILIKQHCANVNVIEADQKQILLSYICRYEHYHLNYNDQYFSIFHLLS
jgi:isoprenylcysteine carboxyl methyltransferase (ICMT) family protein YpbQ